MRRREALAVGGVVLLGGCTGLLPGGDDGDPDATTGSERTSTGGSTTATTTASGGGSGTEPTTAGADGPTRQGILDRYEAAVVRARAAQADLEGAAVAYRNRSLETAAADARGARGQLRTAGATFRQTVTDTRVLEEGEARVVCEDAVRWTETLEAAADAVLAAVEDSRQGDTAAASEHIDAYEGDIEQADRIGLPDPETLQGTLGL